MSSNITVPPIGESITEGLLVEWLKRDGDRVEMDDPLFVLETDKVTMTINAESTGALTIKVKEGEGVKIGEIIGSLDPDAAGSAPQPSEEEKSPPAAEKLSQQGPAIAPIAGMDQVKAKLSAGIQLSPAVRRLVEENRLDPSLIRGTGREGRIIKEDVLAHLAEASDPSGRSVSEGLPPKGRTPDAPEVVSERQTRTRMSPLRARIAERMVAAQQTAAILTTFNEADMTNVIAFRAKHRESFKKRHGVDLGFMSFFVKAVVDALQTIPEVNTFIEGDEVVHNHYYDIGIAIGGDRGLVVPVIKDADMKNFAGIETAIQDFAERVRSRTILLEELQGGVFSISNGGVFGSLLSTPILNPPQSGILGMHAIKKRPVVIDDEIVIRPMMYLAFSYDHRLVDGRESVAFLRRIVECIEDPERMMLEI